MVGVFNTNLPKPVEPNQHALNRNQRPLASEDSGEPSWFLPQEATSLQTITATAAMNLQDMSPDCVASQILSHIGG